MAKFIFRMQNVLNVKLKVEEQKKVEFAIANRQYLDEVEKLDHLKKRKLEFEEKLRQMYASSLKIIEIRHIQDAIEKIKILIKEQEKQVENALKLVDMARVKLNEAMQERKTYEKLREKAFEEFLHEIKVQEDKETDELISFKYGNKANEKPE